MRKLRLVVALASLPAFAQYNIGTFAGGGPNNVVGTIVPVGDITGVVIDPNGSRYFTSNTLHRVFRVDLSGRIYVLVGYGQSGSGGDGGAARDAALNFPRGLALDGGGNLYIADTGNNRIRKVSLVSGTIANFAGTGVLGAGGDGFAATGAQLNAPKGVAIDSGGNVYIADTGNHKIRMVTPGGIISTFAGSGVAGFSGDGLAANSAQLNTPSAIAVDAGNGVLYIADEFNHRIRRVTLGAQNVISSVVNQTPGTAGFSGDGNSALNAQLNRPQGVAVDSTGNLYIADTYNQRIRRVSVTGGNIGNIASVVGNGLIAPPLGDGGPGSTARLNFPAALALDSSGSLFIADTLDDRLRTVPPPYSSATINTIAGDGSSILSPSFFGDNGPAGDAILKQPFAVSVNAAGTIVLIADTYNHLVRSVNLQSGVITTVAGSGVLGYLGDGGAATSAQLNYPTGVALDNIGNIYIADWGNNKIRRVSPGGNISTYAGSPTNVGGFSGNGGNAATALLSSPFSMALDSSNNLYIADAGNHCIRRVAGDTQIISTAVGTCTFAGSTGDGQPPTGANARLSNPHGVAVNPAGTVIYIADYGNNKIRWVSNSVLNTFAGTGTSSWSGDGGPANQATLNTPGGVALDTQGNLFIADTFNQRIRRIPGGNSNNTIVTLAGNGNRGFAGDNGPATGGQLADPYGIAADPVTGRVYFAEFGNNRVRVLFAPCTYQLSPASNTTVPGGGGGYSVQVTAGAGCTWGASVSGGIGWLNITGGQNGSGNGTVSYSVSPNSGVGRSTQLTIAGIPFTVSQAAGTGSSGDFDGDGHLDVIWQDPVTGLAQVWFLGGAQGTTTLGAANLTASNTWRIVGVGDFNRDGRPDVVWQDPVSGAAQVWFLGGAQGNVVTGAAVLSLGNSWRIMSIADFNGDGQPDCIWQDPVTGLAQIWFMGGAQGAAVIGAVNLTASNTWRIAGTGDFNQDGHPDVVWQDPVSGAIQIWYLGGAQGNVVTNALALSAGNSWRIAAVGDFNGDGRPDVVLQDPVAGTSQVWFLGGAQGNTIIGTAPMSGANAWRIAGPR